MRITATFGPRSLHPRTRTYSRLTVREAFPRRVSERLLGLHARDGRSLSHVSNLRQGCGRTERAGPWLPVLQPFRSGHPRANQCRVAEKVVGEFFCWEP